jgi:DNA-binding transcriptional LysR family regulator
MNHYHAKYFVDAVRLKSVVKSAEANFITHPAVSQAIRTLEAELGVPLITHRKRRFELTPEGSAFYISAQDWLKSLEAMKSQIHSSSKDLSGDILFAGAQSIAADFIGPALFQMKREHPKVNMKYSFGDASTIRELVKKGSIQVGFLIDDDYTADFDSKILAHGEFVLISNTPRTQIHQKPLIVTTIQKVEVKNLFENIIKTTKTAPEVLLELVSWSLIRRFALTENFIGYVPDYVVRDDIKNKRLHKVSTPFRPFKYTVKAIWLKNSYQTPALKYFLSLVKSPLS